MTLSNRNIGLGVGGAAILIVALIGAWWITVPSWRPIMGISGSEDSRVQVQNLLMEWRVPYEVDEDTGYLLIEDTLLGDVRNKLATLGVPSDNDPGLEIFSETEYGMSEFTQRINYQRAIEAEIARTIRSFGDVRFARVHLTIPKESIFKDRQVKPKASVVVQPKSNQVIDEDQVQGIAQLVASSVEGLDAKNVIILDDKGVILSSNEETTPGKKKSSSQNLELSYKQKTLDLVVGIVQTDEVYVAVNADINYDRVTSIKEQIIPRNESTSGHLKKKRQQSSQPQKSSSAKAGKNTNTVLEEEYMFSKERSEIEYASGQIQRLTVGIVVAKDISEEVIESIKIVVSAGLGLDMERGDIVTVVSVTPVNVQAPRSIADVSHAGDFAYGSNDLRSQASTSLGQANVYLLGLVILLFISLVGFVVLRFVRKPEPETVLSAAEREKLLNDTKAWLAMGKPSGEA